MDTHTVAIIYTHFVYLTGFATEMVKGAGKVGGIQIVGSVSNGMALECTKRITSQEVKSTAVQTAKATTKTIAIQSVKQTAKVAVSI